MLNILMDANPNPTPNTSTAHAAWVQEICHYIKAYLRQHQTEPQLQHLAQHFGRNENYLQKTFKALLGITPKQYAQSLKENKIKNNLSQNKDITSSIYDAGYTSSSRFYEKSNAILGMTPTEYQSGAKGVIIYFSIGQCALGSVLMAKTEKGVCSITLGNDPAILLECLQRQFPKASLVGADKDFEKITAAILYFIDHPKSAKPDIDLDIQGTAFQRSVWEALLTVPLGQTLTYQALANKIGKPKAIRAVASAVGANNLAVIVPCHRVVRLDNKPSGYRWGLERKTVLLEKEKNIKK